MHTTLYGAFFLNGVAITGFIDARYCLRLYLPVTVKLAVKLPMYGFPNVHYVVVVQWIQFLAKSGRFRETRHLAELPSFLASN